MMTLHELKEIIVIPEDGMKTLSARQLGENGRMAAKNILGKMRGLLHIRKDMQCIMFVVAPLYS